MHILVTGATGFVGSHLVDALVDRGWDVRAMSRHPDDYHGTGRAVAGDVGDPDSLAPVLAGVDVAYYLVHSLGDNDFEARDAAGARNFATAAAAAGVGRIVYLSGLGDDDPAALSQHLRSRRTVEGILAESGVPVTVLRAAIVIGDGGISWEITRQLVKNLPVMVAPRWVATRTQPIALDDTVRYLVAVADHPDVEGRVLEIGGPEAMTYADMLRRTAKARSGRELPILVVPFLTPRLSSLWIALVTDVDTTTARNLIDSMDTEVVVGERSIAEVVTGPTLDFETAVERAEASRQQRLGRRDRRRAVGAGVGTAPDVADRSPLHGFLRASLWDRVPRDHRQSVTDFRRRQWVTVVITIVGALVLAWSLNVEPGSSWFYVATLILAAVWAAGAFASGPLHLGRIGGAAGLRRPITAPILIGLGLSPVFVLGGVVIREIDVLGDDVDSVLDFARQGAGPLVVLIAVVNATAEELFFRGALYAAIPRRQILVTTIVYGLAVAASGNLVLGFAALVLGTVVGWQRRASGGILAPILTHVTWSLCMLAVLPELFSS